MKVTLPNGQKLNFPDGTSEDEMRSAIDSNFPEYAQKKEQLGQQETLAQKLANRLAGNVLTGASETGRNLGNFVGGMIGMPNVPKPNYQQEFGAPKEEEQNIADKLLQIAPDLAVSMVLPETKLGEAGKVIESIPKAGKYLKTALGNALSQGLFAATQSPGREGKAAIEAGAIAAPFSALAKGASEGSALTRLLSKGLLGVGAGGLGYAGAKTAGLGDIKSSLIGAGIGALAATHGISRTGMAKENALKGVEGTEYQKALDAAERLGLKYITPAEASGSPFTGAEQGSIGKTEQGAKLLYKAGQERAATEKNAIENLLQTIFNPNEHKSLRESLYESARSKVIAEEKLQPFQNNEIFKAAEKNVLSIPAYREQLKEVAPNSIEYLDMMKRSMDDVIESAKRSGNKTEARLVKGTQKDLINMLDKEVPDYEKARGIAERGIVRTKLEDYFKKKSESMTGSNFGKFISNDKKYEELQSNLRNVPEAQKQLADMKLIFHRLINIPTSKSAEALSRSSMSKDRASSAAAMRALKEIFSGGKYDKTAVELITNPKWADELKRIKGITNTDKFIQNSANVLGKAGAQSVAQ